MPENVHEMIEKRKKEFEEREKDILKMKEEMIKKRTEQENQWRQRISAGQEELRKLEQKHREAIENAKKMHHL